MSVYKENIVDIDLAKGTIFKTPHAVLLGEGDIWGDRFGVRIFRNGAAESVNGAAVVGYFIRPDGSYQEHGGGTIGNLAYVDFPQSFYSKPGPFRFTLKVSQSGRTSAIRIVEGVVLDTVGGTAVGPGVIPALDPTYMEWVTRAETAADKIDGISVQTEQITETRYRLNIRKS